MPINVNICGISMKIDAIAKMSSPTIDGNAGRKYTDPTMKDTFPIAISNARNAPILRNGYSGVN